MLDLNAEAVQEMAKDGRLPAHRLPGARKYLFFFFFNVTATPEIYTLSLHDALPIFRAANRRLGAATLSRRRARPPSRGPLVPRRTRPRPRSAGRPQHRGRRTTARALAKRHPGVHQIGRAHV